MLYDYLKCLYDLELYEDVKFLTSTIFSLSQTLKEDPTFTTRYQISCLHADAHFHTEDYHSAIKYYKSALQTRALVKGRVKKGLQDIASEADLKYKLYKCFIKLKLFKEALSMLQSISGKQMTIPMKMALAQLIVKINGDKNVALSLYREVISQQPLSFTAIKGFLSLGGKAEEVMRLLNVQIAGQHNLHEWMSAWTKAQGIAEGDKDYSKAADLLHQMSDNSFTGNTHLMAQAAFMYFTMGNYEKAKDLFKWVRENNALHYTHLDSYAFILFNNTPCCPVLESLASKSFQFPEAAVEPWIINGYYQLSFNKASKASKAIFFAQKALQLDPQHFEALLLAGISLTIQSEHSEALVHLRLAIQTCPHRFEPYYFVTEIYWKTERKKEAMAVAFDYLSNYPSSRSNTLHASVLMKGGKFNYETAQGLLRKAIHLDAENHDAIKLLSRVIQTLHGNDEAVQFLKDHSPKKPTASYHKLLASIYLKIRGKKVKALDHIIIAKRLEPSSMTRKSVSSFKFFFQEDYSDSEMDQLAGMGKVVGDEKMEESFLDDTPDLSPTN